MYVHKTLLYIYQNEAISTTNRPFKHLHAPFNAILLTCSGFLKIKRKKLYKNSQEVGKYFLIIQDLNQHIFREQNGSYQSFRRVWEEG